MEFGTQIVVLKKNKIKCEHLKAFLIYIIFLPQGESIMSGGGSEGVSSGGMTAGGGGMMQRTVIGQPGQINSKFIF